MTNMHITSSRTYQWYQKWNEEPHGLGGLRHDHACHLIKNFWTIPKAEQQALEEFERVTL
jgi:hypothetical protein